MTNIKTLFLVKEVTKSLNTERSNNRLPRELHWGLSLLQKRMEICFTPWVLKPPQRSRLRRFIYSFGHFRRPEPKIFFSRAFYYLGKRLMAAEKDFDVVLSVQNVATATLLMLRSKGAFKKPIICLLIAVADWLEKAEPSQRRETLKYLAAADRLLVLGETEAAFLKENGLKQVRFLPFGVDTDYWNPRQEPIEDYVFAMGSDTNRDFNTLIQACTYPLKIMTRNRRLIIVPIPPNVSFVNGNLAELLNLYSRARVVVAPLKDCMQPSGQNTILQAMAMGKVVVLTRIRGIWTNHLRHMENCIYVNPQDPRELQDAIQYVYNHPREAQEIGKRASKTVREYFRVEFMVGAIIKNIYEVARN